MIQWSENFSVLNCEIDEQHKVLISIMDSLAGLLQNEDYRFEAIYDVVTRLDDYITEHFQYEEQLMLQYNYPDMVSHVSQHNKLRDSNGKFNIFDITKPKEFIEDSLVYLVDWLTHHIMNTDKKLGNYINQTNLQNI